MQVAIDGPAGAGKSTVAKELARRLGYRYLDTGAMYRAFALAVLELDANPADEQSVEQVLDDVDVRVRYEGDAQHMLVGSKDVTDLLRSEQAGRAASDVARIPAVRLKLVDLQRKIARRHDIVMDGRDIGSYVLPDADVKIFLTASPEKRAERRCRDLERAGLACDLGTVLKEIRERDAQDAGRSFAPLTHTKDEILLDTGDLTQEEVTEKLCSIVRERTRHAV